MNDMLSGELDDIFADYDGLKLKWQIEFGNEREAERIQQKIDKRNAQISRQQARNELKQSSGEVL